MIPVAGPDVENDPSLLLLEERYAPITSEIGFVEAECDAVVREYLDWQRSIGPPGGSVGLSERRVAGQLEDAISSLLPLVDIERTRYLFVPTAGRWTAYFDNGWTGADVFPPVSYLSTERLHCRGVRAVASREIPIGDQHSRGQYGSVQLDVWGPEGEPPLMYVRSLNVANDGGGWVFNESGSRFPFEDAERYGRRRIRERFTFAMLRRYLESLGIRAFDSGFYMPEGEATLIERSRLPWIESESREFSLEDVRASRGL
jgi:hypothetical protein